jgi:hypothetical protein
LSWGFWKKKSEELELRILEKKSEKLKVTLLKKNESEELELAKNGVA